jgi:hypothetical protein
MDVTKSVPGLRAAFAMVMSCAASAGSRLHVAARSLKAVDCSLSFWASSMDTAGIKGMLVFEENVLNTEAALGLMKRFGLYQSYFPFGSTMVLLHEQLK